MKKETKEKRNKRNSKVNCLSINCNEKLYFHLLFFFSSFFLHIYLLSQLKETETKMQMVYNV